MDPAPEKNPAQQAIAALKWAQDQIAAVFERAREEPPCGAESATRTHHSKLYATTAEARN